MVFGADITFLMHAMHGHVFLRSNEIFSLKYEISMKYGINCQQQSTCFHTAALEKFITIEIVWILVEI